MATKVHTVNICNKTHFTLFRNAHKIRHGTWITWLPEKIKPSSSVSISFTNSRSGHSCKSNLEYGVTLDGILHVLEVKFSKNSDKDDFSCTFKPVERKSEVLSKDNFKIISSVPENICKINTQLIDPSRASFIESSETIYIVNLEETAEGFSYISSLLNRLNATTSKLKGEHQSWDAAHFVGLDLVNLLKRAPPDFCWDYNHLDWTSVLKRSNVSVLIRIVNLTSKDLRLGSTHQQMHRNCVLDEGVWVEYPNEEIGRLCGTEFGCKSNGFLGGATGRCSYSMLGESGKFTFTWDRPSIGAFSAKCKHSLNKYTVFVHTESSNQAIATFHIIDTLAMPLQILTARAVSPKLMTKYTDVNLKGKYFNLNSQNETTNASDNNIDELVITPFMEKYLSSSSTDGDNEQSTAEKVTKELYIKSPRSFFNSVNSTNVNSPINKVSPDSSIYIEWMIGNEIFCKLFKSDEKILINSATVSGVQDTKPVVLNSALLRHDLTSLFAETNAPSKILTSGDSLNGLSRPYLKNIRQSELLDYVVMIFHCVCDGFQPYINRCMTKKFGTNWLKTCKLPPGHIWRNHDLIRIDLEGIIYIVTAYWMEIFEQVLNETTHLNIIQTAAIYWANQELQRFDTSYVWDLLQSSKVLLQKLKAESFLKHIEFISNKLVQS